LASGVAEELSVAAMGRPRREAKSDLRARLGVEELLGKAIHGLSGGESVRLALASVSAQAVDELHIDTCLEQLDEEWRPLVLAMLTRPRGEIAERLFLADNHLSANEIALFPEHLLFPLDRGGSTRRTKTIDPIDAAALVSKTTGETISFHNVSFSYSRHSPVVLDQISLSLQPGALYFLVGGNGSGKSTLVKLLSGTLLPRAGTIRYGVDRFQPATSRNRFAGLAFQNPDFQWTTQTVCGELLKTQKVSHQLTPLEKILPAFGIPETQFNTDPNELSFVLKKRFGIALAALLGRPWLIFDEPTVGQDEQFRFALAEFIRLALTRGVGLIIITHDTAFRALFPNSTQLLLGNRKVVMATS
jgi:energy-coupling factor transporter ATP-binding protein EcfA2